MIEQRLGETQSGIFPPLQKTIKKMINQTGRAEVSHG
jgi:hypothetical protein